MAIEYKTIFKLNDDGKTCIFRDKQYTIQENENERYIVINIKRYKFIEKEEQIKAILASSTEKYDFSYCIFLNEVVFFHEEFNKKVDFTGSTFSKESNFTGSIFKKEVNFSASAFQEETNFGASTFQGKANFTSSVFNKEANFTSSNFDKKINFLASSFNKKANFNNSLFEKKINFKMIKTEFLNFSNVRTKKDFTIDLSYSEIERLNYENTDFKDVQNSESYLKLKNFALKNNDQKNALNFYKKEMEKYRQEANKNQKSLDMFILSFEKFVSDYGTNPFKPLVIMIAVSIIFTLLLLIPYLENINPISTTILLLNPTSSIEKLVDNPKNVPLFWEALNFLKNIFFSILIYEVIKSFRKFSRKL